MDDLPNLNEFKALKRKDQLNESKAFSKSNATTSPGICLVLVYFIISSIRVNCANRIKYRSVFDISILINLYNSGKTFAKLNV
jgi:hypothetical protein